MLARIAFWVVLILVVGAAGAYVAFQVSPWPGALVIRYAFEKDAATTKQALERHLPSDVSGNLNIRYDETDPDAHLDVFFPAALDGTEETLPTIVWIHGGGWVSGSKDEIANYLKILAGEGYSVIGVDYSIAPGAIYPTPLRQVLAALTYLDENGAKLHVDPTRIILAGDSAGAQIAAQIANIITTSSYADTVGIQPTIAPDQLKGIILFCGAYDTRTLDLEGPFGGFLKTVMWSYSGRKDFANAPGFETASVARYVTSAFPAAFVSAGNGDPLAPQSAAMADALTAVGVPVDALFFSADTEPPLSHEYQFDLDTDAGHVALDRVLAFLRRQTASQ